MHEEWEQKLEKSIDKEYLYVNKNEKKGNALDLLEKVLVYENRKLTALRKYPLFEQLINLHRNRIRDDGDDMVVFTNYLNDRFGFLSLRRNDEPFFSALRSLLNAFGLPDVEAVYIGVSYYLLFDSLATYDQLMQLCRGLPEIQAAFVLPDVLKRLFLAKSDEQFRAAVVAKRAELGVRTPYLPEDIAYNYNHFYHLATNYVRHRPRDIALTQTIDKLLSGYHYLNPHNDLDYCLLYNYIVFSRDALELEDVKDFFGTGLVRVHKGEELLDRGSDIKDRIFVDLPPYCNSALLSSLVAYISSRVSSLTNYVDVASIHNWDMMENYYIAQYSYDLEDQLADKYPDEDDRLAVVVKELGCQYGTKRWHLLELLKLRKDSRQLSEEFEMGKILP